MLYTPSLHERLTEAPWDERRARAAIREIAQDAEQVLDGDAGWPSHPRDEDEPKVFRTLYLGAAGVVWAQFLQHAEADEPTEFLSHLSLQDHLAGWFGLVET